MGLGVDREALRIAAGRAPASHVSRAPHARHWDAQLTGEVLGFLDANGFDGPALPAGAAGPAVDLSSLQHSLKVASDWVKTSLDELPPGADRSRVVQLGELSLQLHDLTEKVCEERQAVRTQSISAVRRALSRLHGLESTASVIQTATAEVCASGGFDRAMFFRLERSEMIAEAAHFGPDRGWAAAVLDFARRKPPDLKEMIVESDLARRRLPGLVHSPRRNPRAYRPLVLATDTRSYLAAPIAPEGRVIGFLHADCYFSGRPLDGADRDLLAVFAAGVGYATANAVLRERISREGHKLGALLHGASEVVDRLATETDLAPAPVGDARGPGDPRAAGPRAGLCPSLTSRQIQVLRLMAEGATNAEIADRLVVSTHTAKSHVKHVMRELGVANRTQAAAWYHQHARERGRSEASPNFS